LVNSLTVKFWTVLILFEIYEKKKRKEKRGQTRWKETHDKFCLLCDLSELLILGQVFESLSVE
jgi:hypothetical protein